MKALVLGSIVILCLGVSACGKQPPVRVLTKSSPVGTPTLCEESEGNTCLIKVTVTPDGSGCSGSAVSLPDYIELLDDSKHKKIVWELSSGYKFCPRAGDGAFLDDINVPEDLFDLETNTKCDTKFSWKRKKKDGNKWAYMLRFRDDGNTMLCTKDPWFKNG